MLVNMKEIGCVLGKATKVTIKPCKKNLTLTVLKSMSVRNAK